MCVRIAVFLTGLAVCVPAAGAKAPTRAELARILDSTVHAWRFRLGEIAGAEAADFDDSAWQRVDVGHRWLPHESTCWFRTRIVLPNRIDGIDVAGADVWLKLAVDNGAKVYVNGNFKQEFAWDKGNVLLTKKARPGQTLVVALHAVNGPGYGRLMGASLITAPRMVAALRGLLRSFDIAETDRGHVPEQELQHWRSRAGAALQELDLAAFRARREAAFLASVDRAWTAYLADAARFEKSLDATAGKLDHLHRLLRHGRAAGRQLAYETADARVVESFLTYARQDMADGNRRHQVRALKIASYLHRLCNQAINRAQAIIDDPQRDLHVPRPEIRGLAVRDGAFWVGGKPAFFTGVGHFSQVRQDVPILNDYGLNIIQIEIGPSRVVTGPHTVDTTPIRNDILRTLDAAARHHVAVNLLISPHYFPRWAIDQNPRLAQCGYGFLKYCIDAPIARHVQEVFLRTLMPLIAHHPALHSICLSNEPQYKSTCALARKKFHAWLKAKHGTIDAVNAIYGTAFPRFDAVPIPDNATNYPLFFDWCCFNQDSFLEFHQFLRDLVHQYNPRLPVHAKVMSRAFDGPEQFERGINFEDFNHLGVITGNDCVQTFIHEQDGPYAQEWRTMALNYTLQHGTAPADPIFNSEDHVIPDGEERFIPAAHIRTAFWTQALHGQAAATTWVWERGQGGDLADNILTRPNCVRALGHIGLDLNRLAEQVYALQRVPADLAILYSHSSLLPSWAHVKEAASAFEGAYFTDAPCDFVTERQAVAGALNRYKLVLVPRAANAPDQVVAAFQHYIDTGGSVLTVGDCFTRDPYDRPRRNRLRQHGTGRLVVRPNPLAPAAYRQRLDHLLQVVHATRPIRVTGAHGAPIWGVHVRTARHNGAVLVALVNLGRHPQTIDLRAQTPITRMVNLFDNTPQTLPLTLAPLDPLLLSIE